MIRVQIKQGPSIITEAVLEGMRWRTSSAELREMLTTFTRSALQPGQYVPNIERAVVAHVSNYFDVTVLESSAAVRRLAERIY